MVKAVHYVTEGGKSPFGDWFSNLDHQAAAKITSAVAQIQAGNLGDHKSVGGGVWERHIDYGPGYRLYYAQDGLKLIILLCGGTKKQQQRDINQAMEHWADYKERKKQKRKAKSTDTKGKKQNKRKGK